MEEKDMNLTNEETPVSTEEEKNPKLVKTAIIAACILAAFAIFYFVMQYFANSKPAESPSAPTPAVTAPVVSQQPNEPAATIATAPTEPETSGVTTTPVTTPSTAPVTTPSTTFIPAVPQQKISFEEAMDICQKAATKHLGAGTMILPDFDGNLIEVTYDKKVRPCFVFIAGDAMTMLTSSNKTPKARYVVDTTNGDVYDSISLKYIR